MGIGFRTWLVENHMGQRVFEEIYLRHFYKKKLRIFIFKKNQDFFNANKNKKSPKL